MSGSQDRGVTAADFFHRFPDLAPFLLAELKEATRSQTDLHPSLVSVRGGVSRQARAHLATPRPKILCELCLYPGLPALSFRPTSPTTANKSTQFVRTEKRCTFLAVWAVMVAFIAFPKPTRLRVYVAPPAALRHKTSPPTRRCHCCSYSLVCDRPWSCRSSLI